MPRGKKVWRRGKAIGIPAIVGGLAFLGAAYETAPAETPDGYLGQVATASTGDPVVAVAGDIACPPSWAPSSSKCQHMATSDLLMAMNPDAVLTVGDNQYETGTLAEFQGSYDPSWGRLLDRTFPVPGNHEYDSGGTGYFDYFGPRAGDPSKGYYSFDIGAWHVVALNSECGQVGGCDANSPQVTWLRADLAAHPAACTLAYWHKPRYSSGGRHPSNPAFQALWQALWDARAEIVVSGHAHHYERFRPQTAHGTLDDVRGVRQFVVGTGGRNLQVLSDPELPATEARQNHNFGVLKLVLHANSYDWQFVPTAGGTFTDSGSRTCHSATPSDTQPPTAPPNVSAAAASSTRVDAAWGASTDNVGVTGYRVYRNNTPVGTTGGAQRTYADTGVVAATTYTYEVSALDAAGNESARSSPVTVTTPDPSAPVTYVFAPTDDTYVDQNAPSTNYGASTKLVADASPAKNLLLRFNVATSNCDITGARLRLTVGPNSVDGSLKGGDFYATLATNWSESTVTWANAPAANATLAGSLGQVDPGLTYEVDVSSALTGDGPLSLRATTRSMGAVRYVSTEGSATLGPRLVVTCASDTQPPTAPPNVSATAASSTRVDASWGASTDNLGVTGYRVYRDDTLVGTTGAAQRTYADTGVAAATTYTYEVSALDAAGNESARSSPTTVTTPPPSAPVTYVFAPTDDTYVDQNAPSTNYGAATTLVADASPANNLLLRFNVATSNCDITSAKLRLTVGSALGDGSLKGGDFYATFTTSWSESTVTWANAPAANATLAGSLGQVDPGLTYEVDVSSAVSADGPLSLRATSKSSSAVRYVSKEGSATAGPRLVVSCASA